MTTDRREFLQLMAAGAAASVLQPALSAERGAPSRTRAVLFDGFGADLNDLVKFVGV